MRIAQISAKKCEKTLDKDIHNHAYYVYILSELCKHVGNIVLQTRAPLFSLIGCICQMRPVEKVIASKQPEEREHAKSE